MLVKIENGKPQRVNAEVADPENGVYKLAVLIGGEERENNWVINGRPEDYNYVIVGDKCVIDTDSPKR